MIQSRQLAAIMFTDIVGYTAVMGEDEHKAFELLKKNRQIQRPIIERFNGRWLKEIGDGVLASFSSVSDVVYCAKAIQEKCLKDPDLNLRIGIHVGEVVFEGDDVFGDGVNIASRLEPLAPPGGILVSDSVQKNLLNKKDLQIVYAGQKQLKNVPGTVQVYQVALDGGPEPGQLTDAEPSSGKSSNRLRYAIIITTLLATVVSGYFLVIQNKVTSVDTVQSEITEKSIAVLPLANMSNDQDQQYFSDGMSEEIINALAQIPNLKVASRTSVFQFRGDNQDIKSIAKTLGVAAVLEGSVRKSENRVRVTAQLINAADGFHIWSQTYERELNDIFGIQDELSRAIVDALRLKISESDSDIISPGTSSMAAHNLYLRGRYFWNLRDSESVNKALSFFQRAIELDPNYALAYSGLADSYNMMTYEDEDLILQGKKAREAAFRAIELGNSLAQAHAALGFTEMMIEWDYQAAANSFKRAISLNPNYASAHQWYSELLQLAGDTVRALIEIDRSIELDPLNLVINVNQARYYMRVGAYDTAISLAKKVVELNPSFEMAHGILYGAYYEAGDLDAAFNHFRQSEYATWLEDSSVGLYNLSGWKGILGKVLELQSEDAKVYISPETVAQIYIINNDFDSAIPYLEEAVNRHIVGVIFIGIDPFWRSYHKEPKFQALMQKMGLPVALE